jgi:hypothetical protein
MPRSIHRVLPALLAVLPVMATATDKVAGDRHTFSSPNGVTVAGL